MAQLNKPLVVLAILAGVVITLVFGLKAIGPSFTPRGQRPLVTLDSTRLAGMQAQFDTARDSTRLLVLLSPT